MICFEEIFNDINEMNFNPEKYGKFVEKKLVINGEMMFYNSTGECLKKFIIYKLYDKVDKISFHLSDNKVYLSDMKKLYGEVETAYNFRDDVTVLYFLEFRNYKSVKNLQIEYDGNEALENPKVTKIIAKF